MNYIIITIYIVLVCIPPIYEFFNQQEFDRRAGNKKKGIDAEALNKGIDAEALNKGIDVEALEQLLPLKETI